MEENNVDTLIENIQGKMLPGVTVRKAQLADSRFEIVASWENLLTESKEQP